nr:uncharacterized protein LOC115264525 [Aedes albopictus]
MFVQPFDELSNCVASTLFFHYSKVFLYSGHWLICFGFVIMTDDFYDDLVALAAVAVCIDEKEENAATRKKRRIWTKEWLLDKQKYSNMELLEKLRQTEPQDFKNYLRMNDATFQNLLRKVTPFIIKQDTMMRNAITPEARLIVTLRYLATGNSFQDLKFSSAISPQSIGEIVIETCEAIAKVLKNFIKVPQSAEEWKIEADKFADRTNFPHCVGCIDGKHITIIKPMHSGSYYFNYKKTFSIVLMAVANADADFLMVDIGTNGRVSDGGVFSRTKFLTNCRKEIWTFRCRKSTGMKNYPSFSWATMRFR